MVLTMGDELKASYKKLTTQVVKASVLGSVAIFSTWTFIFVGMMIIPEIGWFVTVDATINGISIYLMFNFAENTYLFLCKPFAVLCYWCFGGRDAAKQAANDKRFLTTMSSVGSRSPEASHSPHHGTDLTPTAQTKSAAVKMVGIVGKQPTMDGQKGNASDTDDHSIIIH